MSDQIFFLILQQKEEKGTNKTASSDEVKTEDQSKDKVGDTLNNNNYAKALEGDSSQNAHDGPASGVPLHPSIEALTAACSEKILNPDFLLQGDGEPFVAGNKGDSKADVTEIDQGSAKTLGKKVLSVQVKIVVSKWLTFLCSQIKLCSPSYC